MMKAEVKSTKMLKELFIGNMTSLWELSGSLVDGQGGLLLLEERDDAGQVWTADRDMLKMSVCTSDIPGMLSEPASLRGSVFCRVVLTSAAVTLRGVECWRRCRGPQKGHLGTVLKSPLHLMPLPFSGLHLPQRVASSSHDLSGETIADKI